MHYEAELVVVIGKKAKDISEADAPNHIFGITAGNDVSERDWQKNDLQWFRAKGSDTFGGLGPCIAQGLNYNDLLVQGRLNGEVRAVATDEGSHFSDRHGGELPQPLRDSVTGRHRLHGNAGYDESDEAGRCVRG